MPKKPTPSSASSSFADQMFLIVKMADAGKTTKIKTVLKHWADASDCQRQIQEARSQGDRAWELELIESRDDHLKRAQNLAPSLEP